MENIDGHTATTTTKKTSFSSSGNDEQNKAGRLDSLLPQSDSWCVQKSNLIRFSHLFTIENFSHCYVLNSTSRFHELNSSVFAASPCDKYKFSLKLFPNGGNDDSKDYVSLFLNLRTMGKVIVNFRFAIVDADGLLQHAKEDRREFYFSGNYASCEVSGFFKFIQRKFLVNPTNRLLPDDKLTLYCEVSFRLQNNFLITISLPLIDKLPDG